MLRILFSAFISMLTLVGCAGPRHIDYFPYHDNGTPKPRVVVMPIIDSTKSGLSWNLSDELSDGLYYGLMDSGQLYVLSSAEMGPINSTSNDFFGSDVGFAHGMCNGDFIVALELVEHSVTQCSADSSLSNTKGVFHPYNQIITLRMRVRVIDIRRQVPRVVLYEVIKSGYVITPSNANIDYSQVCYGSNDFIKTPYGVAHQRMIKTLGDRLESVIQSAR